MAVKGYRITETSAGISGLTLTAFYLPYFSDSPPAGVLYSKTVSVMEADYPTIFDRNATIITGSEATAVNLGVLGFPNVIVMPRGEWIQFSNGCRIERTATGGDYLLAVYSEQSNTRIMAWYPNVTLMNVKEQHYRAGWDIESFNMNLTPPTFSIRFGYAYDISEQNFTALFEGAEEYQPGGADPYAVGGYSGGGGGGGAGNFKGVGMRFTGDMTGVMTGTDTGFFTLYRPSISELQSLASYLWSTSFDLNQFKKLFNNPMDLFLTLNMLPVQITPGTQKQVGFGMIQSGVYMTLAAERYHTTIFGPFKLEANWNGYLDYSPYTKIELFLPYIGVVPLDADDVVNNYIEVVYVIDALSGACVAGVNKWSISQGTEPDADEAYNVGMYSGNAAVQLPITGGDYATLLTGIFSAVSGSLAGMISGGGAGSIAGGLKSASSAIVNEGKPHVQKGGNVTGNHGWLSQQAPYLIMTIPNQCIPQLQQHLEGLPCYVGEPGNTIKSQNGFVRVADINLTGVRATEAERAEIESLLKEGIYT